MTSARPLYGDDAARSLPDNRLQQPLAVSAQGLPAGWAGPVEQFLRSVDGLALCRAIDAQVTAGHDIYPTDPWRALRHTAPADVRAVILGQDPYHGPGEAEGLAFSVPAGVRIPASLRNIRKELVADLGLALPVSGSLRPWADAGVLLLNTSLTVARDRPASHAKLGWALLTDALIAVVAEQARACVFLLWGAHAQAKQGLIETRGGGRHAVLMSNHPSPLSAMRPPVPFLGSRPFSRANAHLAGQGGAAIDWRLVR
ncbi:MAG: uracil-DNA glycosylase [Burkholderiales bacterium]